MQWENLASLESGHAALLQKSPRNQTEEEGTAPSDILLQIVLPIILILAFFAFTSVRSYEAEKQEIAKQKLLLKQETYEAKQKEIEKKSSKLEEERKQLDKMLAELGMKEQDIIKKQQELEEIRQRLDWDEYEKRKKALEQKANELENERKKLAKRKNAVEEQTLAVQELKKNLEDLWKKINETPHAELLAEKAKSEIELQKQKLVAALERVKIERKQEIGFYFLTGKEFEFRSRKIVDARSKFKDLCIIICSVFADSVSRQVEHGQLYQRVLTAAGIKDRKFMPVKGVDLGPYQSALDAELANANQITEDNRIFVKEQLSQYLLFLKDEILSAQQAVVNAYFVHMGQMPMDSLGYWYPDLKQLARKIVIAPTDSIRDMIFKHMSDRLYQSLQKELKEQGYTFLDDIWKRS